MQLVAISLYCTVCLEISLPLSSSLCVSSASDYWRLRCLAVSRSVVDMSSVLVPPPTSTPTAIPIPTPTPTESRIHKSMSSPRCCCSAAARCVHCTCQLSLRLPQAIGGYLSWMPMSGHIWLGLYPQSVYLSACLPAPGCRVYRFVFALQIHRHEKCSFAFVFHIDFSYFSLSLSLYPSLSIPPQLYTNYLHALAIWEFIEQISRYDYGAVDRRWNATTLIYKCKCICIS